MYIVPRRLPTWNRPFPKGVLPVYDEALKFIKKDSAILKAKLKALRADIDAAQQEGKDVEAMKKHAEKLDIESQVNLPSVRWRVDSGLGAFHVSSFLGCWIFYQSTCPFLSIDTSSNKNGEKKARSISLFVSLYTNISSHLISFV
jgi:hypothetical protein